MTKVHTSQFSISTRGKGTYEITEDISLVFPVMIIGAIVILLFFNITFITTFIDGYIIRK